MPTLKKILNIGYFKKLKELDSAGQWWSSGLERQNHHSLDHAQGRGFESSYFSRSFLSAKIVGQECNLIRDLFRELITQPRFSVDSYHIDQVILYGRFSLIASANGHPICY